MVLKKVTTEDGSITFHNSEVDETYHTTTGALQEALEKHVQPSGILNKEFNELVLGDVCFGLGYNSIVAISKYLEKFPNSFVSVYAFENDLEIIKKISEIDFPDEYKSIAKEFSKILDNELEENFFYIQTDSFSLSLWLGDIRNNIQRIADITFDAVFYDPFSPKKQPELWTKDLFDEVFRTMSKNAVLTTYSCAKMVRDNMKQAGFKVIDGPCIGRKSPSTIAKK